MKDIQTSGSNLTKPFLDRLKRNRASSGSSIASSGSSIASTGFLPPLPQSETHDGVLSTENIYDSDLFFTPRPPSKTHDRFLSTDDLYIPDLFFKTQLPSNTHDRFLSFVNSYCSNSNFHRCNSSDFMDLLEWELFMWIDPGFTPADPGEQASEDMAHRIKNTRMEAEQPKKRIERRLRELSRPLMMNSSYPNAQNDLPVRGRRMLPIEINGHILEAVPDTGSIDNIISEKLARQLGAILVRHERSSLYQNACGQTFTSKWIALLPCKFLDEPWYERMRVFSVVSGLAVPLIMGSRFLKITETLTRFKHRLVRVAKEASAKWRLFQTQLPRQVVHCALSGQSVYATADTGSNIDVISLDYARKRNWRIEPIPRAHRAVELADGSIVHLAGRVRCNFELGGKATRYAQRKTFFVLPRLTSDVVLGDETLEEMEVFDTYQEYLLEVESPSTAIELIYWAGGAGWPSLETILDTSNPNGPTHPSPIPSPKTKTTFKRFWQKPKPTIWRASDILGHEGPYQAYIEIIANRHEREKDLFEKQLRDLSGQTRLDAESAEQERLLKHDAARTRLAALHNAAKAASAA